MVEVEVHMLGTAYIELVIIERSRTDKMEKMRMITRLIECFCVFCSTNTKALRWGPLISDDCPLMMGSPFAVHRSRLVSRPRSKRDLLYASVQR